MTRQPGSIRRLWYNWKMLSLPWRRKWLIGFDLEGNTFWEFKDALHSQRNRRIVKYSRWTHHGDVNVTPQWMQWLRHTRFAPPTLAEQQADVTRQDQLKMLAAQADARWSSKPSALDAPDNKQPMQMLVSRDRGSGIRQMKVDQEVRDRAESSPPSLQETEGISGETVEEEGEDDKDAPAIKTRKVMNKEPKDSPWKQSQKWNPGDEWQPQEWAPAPAKRRA